MQKLVLLLLLVSVVLIVSIPVVFTRRAKDKSPVAPTDTLAPSTYSEQTLSPSNPPTPAPSSLQLFISAITDIVTSVSDDKAFTDPNSPQSKALDWLVADEYTSRVPLTNTAQILQRYVLAVLFFSTHSESTHWEDNLNFLTPYSACYWTDGIQGVASCNADDAITTLDFTNGLIGQIPTELAALTSLRELRFLNNPALTGPIPSQLGLLTNLEFISIVGNNVSGTIPSELASLSRLNGFWLHRNSFTGTIPQGIGENMTELLWFWLHENQLTGTIPESLARMENVTNVWLYENQLTGSVEFLCNTSTLPKIEAVMVDKKEVNCSCCLCCDSAPAGW